MVRLQVSLTPSEAEALLQLANEELRDPREQLHVLLRRELARMSKLRGNELGVGSTGSDEISRPNPEETANDRDA